MSKLITTITVHNFQSMVEAASLPVLVDFWADWCGPCRMLAPLIDDIASEYEGRLTVGKVNIDQSGDLAQRFDITMIPTLLIFKNGIVQSKIVGVKSKEDICRMLEPHLATRP
jgi:thioredoxin 1